MSAVQNGPFFPSPVPGAGIVEAAGNATRISAINAARLADGDSIVATTGRLHSIAGSGAGNLVVSGGALTMPVGGGTTYVTLLCDDTVQHMRGVFSWPANASAALALVIPKTGSSFPGVGGTNPPDAGVHTVIACFNGGTGLNDSSVASGGYGPNAEPAIPPRQTISLQPRFPLQNSTRTIDLHCNKITGRVIVMIDGSVVQDYLDPDTTQYLGPFAIFEFFPTGSGSGVFPRMLSIEASSVYSGDEFITRVANNFLGATHTLTNQWVNTPLQVQQSRTPDGYTVVIVSAWIDQVSGDTGFRLTDGTNFTSDQVMARGAFNGRVTFIGLLEGTPNNERTIFVQARNTTGSGATIGQFSSIGFQPLLSMGASRL